MYFFWQLILVILLGFVDQAYAELLEEEEINIPAWFSFNSKDGINVVSGDSILECASIADSCKRDVAVGINCTPPRFIHGLVLSIQKVCFLKLIIFLLVKTKFPEEPLLQLNQLLGLTLFGWLIWQATSKPIVIYPNSGETYNAELKQWVVSILMFFLLQITGCSLWASPPSTTSP